MIELKRGQLIGIPCKVFPGAFHHEAMVIVESMTGEVAGFVRREELLNIEGNQGLIRAVVVDVSADTLTVRLKGSFFTTTGLAQFSPEWARSNAEVLAA